MKLIIIQDNLSPHTNELLNLFEDSDIKVIYYCISDKFNGQEFTNRKYKTKFYKNKLDLLFLYKLARSSEKIIVTGWMNINTMLIILGFFLLRKKYYFYTDRPMKINKYKILKKIIRFYTYLLLRHSRVVMICVGELAVEFFKQNGFKNKLINLPMIHNYDNKFITRSEKLNWRYKNFKLETNTILAIVGSRMEYIKGFDLLIEAVNSLPKKYHKFLKIILYGNGSQKQNLIKLINKKNLSENFIILDWLDSEVMLKYINMSDIYIHPSRFDAYGPSYLPLSMGVTVIGSNMAGAAVDRIVDGYNGFIYQYDRPLLLSEKILFFIKNIHKLDKFGKNAYDYTKDRFSSKNIINNFKKEL
jgi:glycosyltransferase involved in cell wall biosynthesis